MTSPEPEEPEGGYLSLAAILAGLAILLSTNAPVASFVYFLSRIGSMIQVPALREWLNTSPDTIQVELPDLGWPEPLRRQYDQNLQRRASYLVNAARRVSRGALRGELGAALAAERRYWEQHRHAMKNRMDQAQAVADAMAFWPGRWLGWHAKMDDRTSAECRAAHGRNFNPNRIPPIGYPGAVHPHCRCRPGAPWPTLRRVESIRPHRR